MNIFKYNKDIDKNSYINWRTNFYDDSNNFSVLADGYFRSSIILLESCLNDNSDKKADVVIFPILHGIIHGTEIYLKAIYNILARFLEEDRIFLGGHDIKQLLNEVSGIVSRFETKYNSKENIKHFKKEIESVRNFISEVYDKTNSMDFVRYPMDYKKKNKHFYVESSENVVVDLEVLYTEVISMHKSLDCICGYYSTIYEDYLSIINEYKREAESYYE